MNRIQVGMRVVHPEHGAGRVGSVPRWGGREATTVLVKWDATHAITTVNAEELTLES